MKQSANWEEIHVTCGRAVLKLKVNQIRMTIMTHYVVVFFFHIVRQTKVEFTDTQVLAYYFTHAKVIYSHPLPPPPPRGIFPVEEGWNRPQSVKKCEEDINSESSPPTMSRSLTVV